MTNNIMVTPNKGSTGKEMESEANVKDIGIIINEKPEFKEFQYEKIVLFFQVMSSMIIRIITMRD